MWKPRTGLSVTAMALSFALSAPALAEVPKVVASLQPVHSLVAAVMQGVGQPDLIVDGAASEHTYALKPSDARKIAAAQLVVLIDPRYEAFMAKTLKSKPADQILVWSKQPGTLIMTPREGGAWDGDDHHDDHGHHHDEDFDGHLWLDVGNARTLTNGVAQRLAQLDPPNADRYAANAAAAIARLTQLDQTLKTRLAPLADRPYVVFHDAYHYYESRYGLRAAGSITVDPDRPPSAKRLAVLRDKLKGAKAACVFAEPQFPSPLAKTVAEAAGVGLGTLDPQGAAIPLGPDHYPTLLTRLADDLTSCLSVK